MEKIKPKYYKVIDRENDSSDPDTFKTWWALIVFAVGVILYFLVYWNFSSLPSALLISDIDINNDKFISERAYINLVDFVADGPRITGSVNNEVNAVNFIKSTLEDIIKAKNSSHSIEIDHQIVAGDFAYGRSLRVYRGVQNIIAKLTPADQPEPENYFMLSSHFDSVVGSPGAADDGVGVVILFEVLRVLSQLNEKLKHGIIFVWNGSEEFGLQGAHGFIAHHKWANKIRAFINIDGTECEIRELMLQVGPKHSWLMNVSFI